MHGARIGHHRPIDCGPLDIDCSVVISGELMVTHDTTKLGLAFAVAAFDVPAHTTALASVGRIDKRYRYTGSLRLIADKRSQLAEGPIAVSCSLPWPFNPRPLANALEILKNDHPLRAFGFGNQPLADLVVGVFLKSTLAASELVQAALGRLRSNLLECLATIRIPLAAAFNVLARKRFTITIGCQIDDTEIDAQHAFSINRFGRLNLTGDEQIPLATHERQIGFSALPLKQFALAFATDKQD